MSAVRCVTGLERNLCVKEKYNNHSSLIRHKKNKLLFSGEKMVVEK